MPIPQQQVAPAMGHIESSENPVGATLRAYEKPDFERRDLRIVTLGGDSGEGDSGNQNTELPASSGAGAEMRDWDDDSDGDGWGSNG